MIRTRIRIRIIERTSHFLFLFRSLLFPSVLPTIFHIPLPVRSFISLNYPFPTLAMARDDFVLAPCSPEDIEDMIDIYFRAFHDDYFGSYCFPAAKIPRDEWRRWLQRRFLNAMSRPENRTFKVTEAHTGKMAAWARWSFPYKFSEEEKAEREREEQEKEKAKAEGTLQEYPPGANLEACEIKFGELSRLIKKHVNLEDMYSECRYNPYNYKARISLIFESVVSFIYRPIISKERTS